MADYRTSDEMVNLVFGLLTSLTVPRFAYVKPTRYKIQEYVVINGLPINAAVMQKCYINVNYHVRDIEPGVPDMTKLQAGSTAVLNILQKVDGTDYLIDFESQELFREEALEEHFSNLRFSIKTVNT